MRRRENVYNFLKIQAHAIACVNAISVGCRQAERRAEPLPELITSSTLLRTSIFHGSGQDVPSRSFSSYKKNARCLQKKSKVIHYVNQNTCGQTMTDPNHEQYAATLHDCARRKSHPDSEEAVQIERQRVARELEPFGPRFTSRATSHASSHGHSRTRQTSHISATASNAPLQDRDTLESYAAAQPDAIRSQGSSVREVHWYSPVVNFWTTHVRYVVNMQCQLNPLTQHSLTIDEGAHRDHLGTILSCLLLLLPLTPSSPRKNLPWLSANISYSGYDGCHNRTALSDTACVEPGSYDWFLRYRQTAQRDVHWHGHLPAPCRSDSILAPPGCLGPRKGACGRVGDLRDYGCKRSCK